LGWEDKTNMDALRTHRKVMAQTGEIRCAMDHILEAERKGEINHDNVLYIVENINVAGIDNLCSVQ
jgi:trans-cinnamate 4-monooxygenase